MMSPNFSKNLVGRNRKAADFFAVTSRALVRHAGILGEIARRQEGCRRIPQEFVILRGVCPSSGDPQLHSRQMLGYLCDKREMSGLRHPRRSVLVSPQHVHHTLPTCSTQFAFNPLINSLRSCVLYDQSALYCHFLFYTHEPELMRSTSPALFLIRHCWRLAIFLMPILCRGH